MLLLVSFAVAAPVAECARPFSSAEIMDAADRAEGRFAEQDPEGFATAQGEVVERLGCVADPLSPTDVVRVHRVVALGAFMKADEPVMRAAVAGMVQVDIRARFPEAVVPTGHKLDKLLDELAGSVHTSGTPLRVFSDGWVEVNGSYAPTVQDDVAATLQRLDNQGKVVETRYWLPGQALGDWEGQGGAVAGIGTGPKVSGKPSRPTPKRREVAPLPTSGAPHSATDVQIAKENAAARHVALIVSTGAGAIASGVVYALAADAKEKALDPSVPLADATAYRDQANGLTWGWIGGAVLSTGLATTLVVTW